jgi:hypothetical protein
MGLAIYIYHKKYLTIQIYFFQTAFPFIKKLNAKDEIIGQLNADLTGRQEEVSQLKDDQLCNICADDKKMPHHYAGIYTAWPA